jgi:hypothetical protein
MMAMEDGAERSLPQIAEKCGWFHKSGEPNKQLAKRLLDGLPAGLASQNKASKNWRLTDKGRAEAKRLAERPL